MSAITNRKPLPCYTFLQAHTETPLIEIITEINNRVLSHQTETDYEFLDWANGRIFSKFQKGSFERYVLASSLLNKTDYSQKPLKNRSVNELIQFIMQLYKCVNPAVADGYRSKPAQIFNPEKTPSRSDPNKDALFKEAWDDYFENQPAKDRKAWKEMRTRVYNECVSSERTPLKMRNVQELDILLKHGFMLRPFVPHKGLQKATKKFASALREKLNNEPDVFKVMAFAHHGLVKLHIKGDENGRTSRLFMHLIGWDAGQNPIIIRDSKKYTEHIEDTQAFEQDLKADAKDQQAFFDSLSPLTWNRIELIFNTCVLEFL